MADNDEHRQEETYEVTGDGLLGKVKQLIHEGNVRKIILRREDGWCSSAGSTCGGTATRRTPALVFGGPT